MKLKEEGEQMDNRITGIILNSRPGATSLWNGRVGSRARDKGGGLFCCNHQCTHVNGWVRGDLSLWKPANFIKSIHLLFLIYIFIIFFNSLQFQHNFKTFSLKKFYACHLILLYMFLVLESAYNHTFMKIHPCMDNNTPTAMTFRLTIHH